MSGRLIYQNFDDDGIIEVVEQDGVRSLHFGTSAIQSSLRLGDPERLELTYLRAMSSWLLFADAPQRVLLLGLGGGSLARFLLYNFPECRLAAVESREQVIKIARQYFGLPLDRHLKVVHGDAGEFVRRRAQTLTDCYCLICVDIFTESGMAPSLAGIAFFDACRELLRDNGILVVNLWNSDNAVFSACCDWLSRAFQERVLLLPIQGYDNVVAIAFNEGLPAYSLSKLRQRAVALEAHYRIEFSRYLKMMRPVGNSRRGRIIKQ